MSRKYKLTLIDKNGQELQIDVYGMATITSDIQTINLPIQKSNKGRNNKTAGFHLQKAYCH